MSPVTYTYPGKKAKMTAQNPYDFGQEALYGPAGYQGAPNPVDWGSLFGGQNTPQHPIWSTPGDVGTTPGGGGRGNAYADLINRMLTQQRSDLAGEGAADAAGRDAAIKRILVSYGAAPDVSGLGGEAQGILGGLLKDQGLQDLIAKNTAEGTSIKARQEQANVIAQRQIGQGVARKGLLHSGETGYQQGQQEMAHKQTAFDTLSQALGEIEGSVGTFAANERARQRQLADYENQAAMAAFQFADDTQMGPYPGGDPYAGNQGVPTPTQTAAKQQLYQAVGPYGPYGPAKYTIAQRNAMMKKLGRQGR